MKKTVLFLILNFGFVTANAQTLIGNSINGSFGQELSLDIAINSNGDKLMFGIPNYPNSNNGIVTEYSMGSSWQAINAIVNDPIQASRFGTSLSISNNGNRVAIGAPFHWYHQPFGVGKVYVYDYNVATSNWELVGNIIDGVNTRDLFGQEISLSADGNRLAISGYLADVNGITDSGLVRVFQFNSSNSQWEQMGDDFYDNEIAKDFGSSCVLSKDGSTLVIGIPGKSSNQGETRVYRWYESGSFWGQVGATLMGDNTTERFGSSVVVNHDGTLLTIGSVSASVNNVNYVGRVRTFRLVSGSWVEFSTSLYGENESNYFGGNLAMSDDGTVLAVAAVGWESFQGRVYVYSLVGNEWVQKTSFNGTSHSRLGDALSLTSDGNRIALGSKPNGGYRVMLYDIANVLNANQFVTENTKIYPNPAKENISVSLNSSLEFINSRIYNAVGQLVTESNSKVINVQHLSKGLYFIEIQTNKGKGVQKFIKE